MKNKEITIYDLIGLIKDNKAPKKIKYGNDVFYYDKDFQDYKAKECSDNENEYLFYRLFKYAGTLDTKIEILSEENDEWKDIEEINVDKENCKRFIEYDSETGHHKYTIRLLDEYFSNKINQLIKNQKYLKERIDKNE